MKKSRHSEHEIVKAVNQLDSGLSADVICREYGISRATLYNWRSKYSGMVKLQVGEKFFLGDAVVNLHNKSDLLLHSKIAA